MDQEQRPTSTQASDHQAQGYALVAALALLTYDTILTFDDEFHYVWSSRPWRIPSLLYFISRFGCLLQLTAVMVPVKVNSLRVCNIISFLTLFSAAMAAAGVHGLLLARAYAITKGMPGIGTCGRRHWSIVFMGLLYTASVGLNFARVTTFRCDNLNFWWWDLGLLWSQPYRHPYVNAPDLAFVLIIIGLVFDVSILAITLQHTRHQWQSIRCLRLSVANGPLLTQILINQGIIRFLLICAWALEGAIKFKTVRMTITGIDAGIENACSVILVCRFFLQLRKRNAALVGGESSQGPLSRKSTYLFRRMERSICEDMGYFREQ